MFGVHLKRMVAVWQDAIRGHTSACFDLHRIGEPLLLFFVSSAPSYR